MPSLLDKQSILWLPIFLPIFIVDLILSLILQFIVNPRHDITKRMQSVEANGSRGYGTAATDTHGAARWSPKAEARAGLFSVYRDTVTVYEMVQLGVQEYADNRIAQEHFEFLSLKKLKETDRFPSKQYSDKLVQVTYKELGENIDSFGKGLREIGMTPQPQSDAHDYNFDHAKGNFTMVIFEDTCKEWTTAMQGALSQSMVVATCYATLGHEAVVSAVNETQASALFVNWKEIQEFYHRAKDMPSLKTIIASTHECPPDSKVWSSSDKERDDKIKIITYDDLIALGKKSTKEPVRPKPSDIAVIMYTSGSTGSPKGVVMKHSNIVAGIAGMITNVDVRPGQERFVSYLPLAHILALQVEHVLLSYGATLCYSDSRQLATAMPKFQPTIFAGVPKVYEILQTGLLKKLDKGPKPLKVVFDVLLSFKTLMLSHGLDSTPISNEFFGLICTKIFGRKRLEFGVTGGGPMSANLQLFSRAVFNCPIIQGYALTETCVGGCFQSTKDQRPGVVGPPVPCVEIVLQSEPDIKDSGGMPYLHTDTTGAKGEKVIGRGEICMRGPCISNGYYKNPDKTKEDFDKEGFFHTGDIGQFTADGCIQIVDRKKNLVKLKGGEYVAVEAMESAFSNSPYASMLCVIANGDLDGPLAVVCTDNDAMKKWAEKEGISYEKAEDLADNQKARDEVVKSFKEAGTEAGLSKLELRIKDCVLVVGDQWGPGNGMTASMKLDRKEILKMYDEEIEAMYKRVGANVSS